MTAVRWVKDEAYLGEACVGSAYEWGNGASWSVYLPDNRGHQPPTNHLHGADINRDYLRLLVEIEVQDWLDRSVAAQK